ncbi:MAG: hypothetical protein US58_C0014G0044 [Candidatus Magasanikbacteria bacterium GW2011_GWA2_37_8]|uniref:Uncharacterized protein n=1 Tax=Candidatus Magasanikbacteria bacterium GW2011_GWA2_37_8 TaxID=1619036 RepID=A0A0G0HER2_9BACT|nr:MAG: hypothetical protein US58_C0014G0044 [Candidatus Magasanikbacteria bacterium GW2011_GWA2_37_8]
MSYDHENHLSIEEQIKNSPAEFGLDLANSDARRSIYIIQNETEFFAKAKELGISVADQNKISELFVKYPNGLKQFFIINKPAEGKNIRLGDHYHTDVKSNGSGAEIFVFTNVPAETEIKTEQYSLGRSKGIIKYAKTGTVMENKPDDYHVFESNGAFKMVQVLEGGFKAEDLKKLNEADWSKNDNNLIKGRGFEN